MEKEEAATPYLSIELPGKRVVSFDSQEDVDKWLERVGSINVPRTGRGTPRNVHATLHQLKELTNKAFSEMTGTLTPTNIQNNAIVSSTTAANYFASRRLIAPETKEGQALLHFHEAGDIEAAVTALALLLDQPVISGDGLSLSAVRAIFAVGMLEKGLPSNPLQTIEEMRGELRTELSGFQERMGRQLGKERADLGESLYKSEKKLEEIVDDYNSSRAKMADFLQSATEESNRSREQREEVEDWHRTQKDELSRLRESYESKVQTEAAYNYWTTKEQRHKSTGYNLLIVGFLYILTVGASLAWALKNIPEDRVLDMPFWAISLIGLIVIFAVWGGRILSKLYLSQQILREEAAERATMVQTYVAMVKETGASMENLSVVLQALFRPSPKGLGQDDGSPLLPQELLVKHLSGETGRG